MLFFLTFVLPQFANVFRDFNAKLDPVLVAFLGVSEFLRANADALGAGRPGRLDRRLAGGAPAGVRARFVGVAASIAARSHGRRATSGRRAFCRNLGLLSPAE